MISLPEAFVSRMKAQLGSGAGAFFAAMEQPYTRGLRVNPLKTPSEPLDNVIQGLGDTVPWAADGRYLAADSAAGGRPLHDCGAYYIQEPSAMLPARLLDAKPGQTVLDLCAAPGGKSTQLAAMMGGQGTLVCNEVAPARAEALGGNLERMGVRNALAVSACAERLARMWPQLFDSVLADAPCSGEGMFRRHPQTRLEWTADTPAQCARRQLHILTSAAKLLKVGGRLCYSTCTFSEEENEGVIDAFLSSHPIFKPVEYSVPIGGGRELCSQNGCIRLYPHTVRGEGHFTALLQKTDTRPDEAQPADLCPADRVFASPDRQSTEAFRAFWAELCTDDPPVANAMIGNLLVSAPPLPPPDGLKICRAGLSLGRMKGRAFIPDHALALAAPPFALRTVPLREEAAANYLRGEALPAGDIAGGFWTVSYAGLPLGFVKHSDRQLKNHYPKGLRKR
ncbi:MAG: RsmF rRNA methyltransferase first C-terminal domain-containing protein [Clostridiales bacterium]|nr:RsmF rRNA methyltransferase first C-terminal domain-containing protein [Clostridiales bacterium]